MPPYTLSIKKNGLFTLFSPTWAKIGPFGEFLFLKSLILRKQAVNKADFVREFWGMVIACSQGKIRQGFSVVEGSCVTSDMDVNE